MALQPYAPGTAYQVSILADFASGSSAVIIDGTLRTGLQILNSGSPTGTVCAAGHGSSPDPEFWFDDVKVTYN